MQLINVLKKRYWMFCAINLDMPLTSEMLVFPTKEEAMKEMDKFLPIEIELETIQRLRHGYYELQFDEEIKSRDQILEEGYFYNPFGSICMGENYNGYFSLYMVMPVYDSHDTRTLYETISARSVKRKED